MDASYLQAKHRKLIYLINAKWSHILYSEESPLWLLQVEYFYSISMFLFLSFLGLRYHTYHEAWHQAELKAAFLKQVPERSAGPNSHLGNLLRMMLCVQRILKNKPITMI